MRRTLLIVQQPVNYISIWKLRELTQVIMSIDINYYNKKKKYAFQPLKIEYFGQKSPHFNRNEHNDIFSQLHDNWLIWTNA